MPYRMYRSREVIRLLRMRPEEIVGRGDLRLLLAEEARRDLRCLRLHRRVEAELHRQEGEAALRSMRLRHRRPAEAIRRVVVAHEREDLRALAELTEPMGGWLGDFSLWFGQHRRRLSVDRTLELFGVAAERSVLLRSGDPEAVRMALHTCERMAAGGIHDQIGGGFSRYSVDAL